MNRALLPLELETTFEKMVAEETRVQLLCHIEGGLEQFENLQKNYQNKGVYVIVPKSIVASQLESAFGELLSKVSSIQNICLFIF